MKKEPTLAPRGGEAHEFGGPTCAGPCAISTQTATTTSPLFFVGMEQIVLAQHWGSGAQWPTLEEIPELMLDQFLKGAAPRSTSSEENAT